MQDKISDFVLRSFSVLNNSPNTSNIHLTGVDENVAENFRINFLDLIATGSNVGQGSSVFKDKTGKQLNFRKLNAASNKVSVLTNSNTIEIDLNESNLDLSNLGGIVPLDKGGTGQNLSEPTEDKLIGWDNSDSSVDWLNIGSNLSMDNKTLNADFSTPLIQKGDILTYGSTDSRLPVGDNDQVLTVDSNESLGVKWAPIPNQSDEQVKVDSSAQAGYIGNTQSTGVVRTDSTISKSDQGDYVVFSVNESNLDLDDFDNSNANFEEYYDSGWQLVPEYNGTTGIPTFTNGQTLEFRVINRVLYFRGRVLLPLEDSSGNAVTDADNFKSVFNNTLRTTGTGYNILFNNNTVFETPVLFSEPNLRNSYSFRYADESMRRRIYSKSQGRVLNYYCQLSNLDFNDTGTIRGSTISSLETPSSMPTLTKQSILRNVTDVVNTDDYVIDYSNYRTSFDSSGNSNEIKQQGSQQHALDLDTSFADQLGGFIILMDHKYYLLNENLTIDEIRNSVDNETS